MRHGYCTAELIIWYIVKQLTQPLDVNEVTMQIEGDPHTSKSATLDTGSSLEMVGRGTAPAQDMRQTCICHCVADCSQRPQ